MSTKPRRGRGKYTRSSIGTNLYRKSDHLSRQEQRPSDRLRNDESANEPHDHIPIAHYLETDERGDSRLLTRLLRGRFCYDRSEKQWYKFTTHWERDIKNEILTAVDRLTDEYATELEEHESFLASLPGGDPTRTEIEKLCGDLKTRIARLNNLQRRKRILELAASGEDSLCVTPEVWDRQSNIIPCANGVIDLSSKSAVFRRARPEDYIRTYTPVSFDPSTLSKKSAKFEKFIDRIFGGNKVLISFTKRFLGYALLEKPVEDVFVIFHGTGRNGKTTLLEIIGNVLGPLAGLIRSEMLLRQKNPPGSNAPTSDIMDLKGKRIVWSSETAAGRSLDANRVKWLTGSDTLTGRTPHARHEEKIRPTHTIIMLTNHKPEIDLQETALWHRLLIVSLEQVFLREPNRRAGEKKADPQLKEEILTNPSGVLAWLVQGCVEYLEDGLSPPVEVRMNTEEYRRREDSIGWFVESDCELRRDVEAQSRVLYDAYRSFCLRKGIRSRSWRDFGQYLQQRFCHKKPGNRKIYIGIRPRKK